MALGKGVFKHGKNTQGSPQDVLLDITIRNGHLKPSSKDLDR